MFRLAIVAVSCVLLFATPCYGASAVEQVANATCKVRATDGSTGSGWLYFKGEYKGNQVGCVMTAAHVISNGNAVCTFETFGKAFNARVLGAYVIADCSILVIEQGVESLPSPVWRANLTSQTNPGQNLFSVGHPSGGRAMLWVGYATKYDTDGALMFWPAPEKGRSGSGIFATTDKGAPVAVGIVSARNTSDLTAKSVGRASTWQQLYGRINTGISPHTWYPVQDMLIRKFELQCPPGAICPVAPKIAAQPDYDPYHLLPYRHQQEQRMDQIQRQIQQAPREISPGTLPLPQISQTPPVDLAPLDARVTELERATTAQGTEIIRLGETEKKAKELADLVAKRDEAFAKDLAGVRGEAEGAKKLLSEVMDEDNPKGPVAKAKAWVASHVSGLTETMTWWRWGIVGVVAYLLFDLYQKRAHGKPLVIERVADVGQRIAERTSTEVDDKIWAAIGRFAAGVGNKVGGTSTPPVNPPQNPPVA